MLVAFSSEKGGAGKTVSSTAVATCWHEQGLKTLLVDLDRQGTSRDWKTAAEQLGVDAPNVIAMGEGFEDDLPALAATYDRVVIDAPGAYGRLMAGCLSIVDVFLIPVRPGFPDLWSTLKTYKLAERAMQRREELKAFAMLTQLDRRETISKKLRPWLEERMIPVLDASFGRRTEFSYALGQGMGPTNYAPDGVAAKEVRALCSSLDRIRSSDEVKSAV